MTGPQCRVLVRSLNWTNSFLLTLGALLFLTPLAGAQLGTIGVPTDPGGSNQDPGGQKQVNTGEITNEVERTGGGLDGGGNGPRAPGSGDGAREIGGAVAATIVENWALTTAIAAGILVVGFSGWLLASRYVDPKVALQNPQRSMLYGFIKGNPGVHLKQLSTEFRMKTSTVLWHIRKLEHADLVRSRKANGYRVFYPVSGGMEAKQLSTAVTALSNPNAKGVFEFVALNPGAHRRILASRLSINPGTIRWHLRKLREAGLVAELAQDRFSTYYATEIGLKAMRQVASLPPEVMAPVIHVAALPSIDAVAEEEERILA